MVELKKNKRPWPTKKAMVQIYDKHLWGSNNSAFYSGFGSHDKKIVNPYLDVVISFLSSFKKPLTVCDFGCGDFAVGSKLVAYSSKFIAIDIVPKLIDYNRKKFTNPNLEFRCLDISKDTLPKADCVIVRQVLQHLSNKEVASILTKLMDYKYIILTEHLPNGQFIPNKDIIAGQGIRIKKQSGLCLTKPPFNFKPKVERFLQTTQLTENKGNIKTILYENFR